MTFRVRFRPEAEAEALETRDGYEDLVLFDIVRHRHVDLLERSWELRENLRAARLPSITSIFA